jgi:hypothetical protein
MRIQKKPTTLKAQLKQKNPNLKLKPLKPRSFRVCLFCTCFCVCGAKNTIRYLVTIKNAFYTARPTKKLSLKRSFREAVFT